MINHFEIFFIFTIHFTHALIHSFIYPTNITTLPNNTVSPVSKSFPLIFLQMIHKRNSSPLQYLPFIHFTLLSIFHLNFKLTNFFSGNLLPFPSLFTIILTYRRKWSVHFSTFYPYHYSFFFLSSSTSSHFL